MAFGKGRVWRRVAAGCGLLLWGCSGPSVEEQEEQAASAEGKVQVAVSVPPQAYFVDRIGGERVDVQVMIPPGTSPHAFEPTPQQMVAFSRARLYVRVGHPDFPFEKKHLDGLLRRHPEIEAIDMAEGVRLLRAAEPEGHGGDHGHGDTDPHVWLCPEAVALSAPRVAMALARLDPAHAELYEANLAAFLADLAALDEELRASFAGLEQRRFMVQHPAWGYLAAHYGLEQIAIESGGKEPGPAALVALIERARQEGVRVVFVQQGIADRTARTLAREVGAEVAVVDPLAYDWIENLRSVGAAFRKALEDG